jgi:hypothetical protein
LGCGGINPQPASPANFPATRRNLAAKLAELVAKEHAMGRLSLTAAIAAVLMTAAPARADDAAHPTVVELFQSQGCSSCPPANANVFAIADRPEVIALTFSVTYWDNLGWKDTFATPQYTQRQWAYAHALGHPNVFTPQVVINGRIDGDGINPAAFQGLLHQGGRPAPGPAIQIGGGGVAIGSGPSPARPADVWLVRYDPRVIQVPIRRGENGGKTLPHKNIVKAMVRLGAWRGAAERFALAPPADPALRTAILVQAAGAGPILAAAKG